MRCMRTEEGRSERLAVAFTHAGSQRIAFRPSHVEMEIEPGTALEDLCGTRCPHARLDQHFESLSKATSRRQHMPDDRGLQSSSAVTLIGSLAYLLFLLAASWFIGFCGVDCETGDAGLQSRRCEPEALFVRFLQSVDCDIS